MNKGQLLPLTDDIRKLQCYLKEKSSFLTSSLQKSFLKSHWELLNQLTLAQLVMFNRRRGGETQRITVERYAAKLTKNDPLKEIVDSLSPVEKMLCETFGRVEIRGKKGRTVPVLFTTEIQHSIDLLLKWRKEAGIPEDNRYLFPRPNKDSLEPIRSSDVLRRFASEVELSSPENITSTQLRKHVATVSQILNLEKNDLEVMAGFLGHDIDIHRSFYRLPQETVQIARMGRLLTAFDNGTIGNYSGKTLDDIDVEDVDLECDKIDDVDDVIEDADNMNEMDIDSEMDELDSDIDTPAQIKSIAARTKGKAGPVGDTGPVKATRGNIQHLTQEQSEILHKLFNANVAFRRELKREECLSAINRHACLRGLRWKKVKNTVHNWITAQKRKISKVAKPT